MKRFIKLIFRFKHFFVYNLLFFGLLFIYQPSRKHIFWEMKKVYWELFFKKNETKEKEIKKKLYNINKINSFKKLPHKPHFIIAGHAYGHHDSTNLGINSKLNTALRQIKNDSTSFIIFTGDFTRGASLENIKTFENEMTKINIPYYLALGNNDSTSYGVVLLNKNYGNTYYTFSNDFGQFIVLNTEEENYQISSKQLEFLTNILDSTKSDNIFILSHKLMWVNHSPLTNLKYDNHYNGYFDNQFWKKIFPKLINSKKIIYCIAGDVGGMNQTLPGSYEKIDNIALISSGMGHVFNENLLVISKIKDSILIQPLFLRNGEIVNIESFEFKNHLYLK